MYTLYMCARTSIEICGLGVLFRKLLRVQRLLLLRLLCWFIVSINGRLHVSRSTKYTIVYSRTERVEKSEYEKEKKINSVVCKISTIPSSLNFYQQNLPILLLTVPTPSCVHATSHIRYMYKVYRSPNTC